MYRSHFNVSVQVWPLGGARVMTRLIYGYL